MLNFLKLKFQWLLIKLFGKVIKSTVKFLNIKNEIYIYFLENKK